MPDAASDLIDRYIAAWNETDPGRRRDLVARVWTDDATYVDPLMRGDGAAGIDAIIAGVQAQFPGWRFARTGRVDAYADRVRFSWEIGRSEEHTSALQYLMSISYDDFYFK